MSDKKKRYGFSAMHHIPKYSKLMIQALQTPLIVYFALAGNFFMFASAAVFWNVETGINPEVETFADALWWALATVSTVGYGDIVPITLAGRLVSSLLILVGILLFLGSTTVLVSVITSLSAAETHVFDQKTELRKIRKMLEKIEERIDD